MRGGEPHGPTLLLPPTCLDPGHRTILPSSPPNCRITSPDGYSALALATLPSALAAYRQALTPTQAANASQAFSDALGPLNDPTYGLLPYLPTLYSGMPPSHADIVLNSWASWLAHTWSPKDLPEVGVQPGWRVVARLGGRLYTVPTLTSLKPHTLILCLPPCPLYSSPVGPALQLVKCADGLQGLAPSGREAAAGRRRGLPQCAIRPRAFQ